MSEQQKKDAEHDEKFAENDLRDSEQDEKIEATVAKNEKIGTVTYFLDGKMLKQYDVVTVNAIKEKDLLWCINMLSREYLL